MNAETFSSAFTSEKMRTILPNFEMEDEKMKKSLSLLLALLMVLSLCACGAGSKSDSYEYAVEAPAAAYMSADMAAEEAGYGGFSAAEGTNTAGEPGSDAPETDPSKIIYSASATVETTDFDGSIAKLLTLVEENKGWIEASSMNGANYRSIARGSSYNRSASYTLRIPSNKFELLMGSLPEIGNVPYSHTYTENVTSQYYDTQARLTAYQTQETRLLEMMEKAETVSDVIAIEEKLTELRYQIESLQSALKNWDRQVSYSTIDLEVMEVSEYTPEPKQSYGQELWQALTGAFADLGQFFKDLLVFLVSAIPTILVLTALFFIFRPLIRKLAARRREKKELRRQAKAGTEKKE